VIRPVLGQPAFSIVMLTFGVGYIARGAAKGVSDSEGSPGCMMAPVGD
jgi:hypothetical protein